MILERPTSQNWRTFLRNQAECIAAIGVFVVLSASFRLIYVMIILAHDRRKIVRTAVNEHPTAAWLSHQVTEAFPCPYFSSLCLGRLVSSPHLLLGCGVILAANFRYVHLRRWQFQVHVL